jgi:chorismate synthase
MGSVYGNLFRISTFGESHGGGVGVVLEGCPPRLSIDVAEIQRDLDRRRPGQSVLTTPRQEADQAEILSGVFEGKTLGTPIGILVRNKDARPSAYEEMRDTYRPSHADFTTDAKYGIRNWQGGGRASARETIGRVAAGAIARKLLHEVAGIEVLCWVRRVQNIDSKVDPETVSLEEIEANDVRCPDSDAAEKMYTLIDSMRRQGDSIGGVVECVIGSGFGGTALTGSQHNDPFEIGADGRTRTTSNRSGGIQGGISNGESINLRVAFKPTAPIRTAQQTVTSKGEAVTLAAGGRHDPCGLPRAVPMVEAMVCLTLADHWLRQHAQDVIPRDS